MASEREGAAFQAVVPLLLGLAAWQLVAGWTDLRHAAGSPGVLFSLRAARS